MLTKIGIVAGEIWNTLEKKDKVKISDIVNTLDKSQDVILMSIGWLAREGHIILEGSPPDYEVSLRK